MIHRVFSPRNFSEGIAKAPKNKINISEFHKSNTFTYNVNLAPPGSTSKMPSIFNTGNSCWFSSITTILWYSNLYLQMVEENTDVPINIVQFFKHLEARKEHTALQIASAKDLLNICSANLIYGEQQCCAEVFVDAIIPLLKAGKHSAGEGILWLPIKLTEKIVGVYVKWRIWL